MFLLVNQENFESGHNRKHDKEKNEQHNRHQNNVTGGYYVWHNRNVEPVKFYIRCMFKVVHQEQENGTNTQVNY